MNLNQKAAPIQIALDGTPASGKSTVGTMLADRLACDFLDTGLMYRAMTYLALENSLSLDDSDALGALAEATSFSLHQGPDGSWRLMVNDRDISDRLHSEDINRDVSQVAAVPQVRRALVRKQREIASKRSTVMAGQDIGTVVLVNAPVKIYLNASVTTRAARRTRDTSGNSEGHRYEVVLNSIKRRSEFDTNRVDSALRPADDAIVIATDDLTADEVVEKVLSYISTKLNRTGNLGMTGKRTA